MARVINDNIDLVGNQALQFIVENVAGDPGTLLGDGRLWYDTVADVFKGRANSNTITFSAGTYTDEQAEDAVGNILTDSSRIDFTYNDGANTITADLFTDSVDNTFMANMAQATIKGRAAAAGTGDPTDLSAAQVKTILALVSTDLSDFTEAAQDAAGAMFVGTETGIAVTYQDGTNTVDFVVGTLDTLPTPVASLSLNSQKITNLADGTAASDAATFGQLSAAVSGFDWKEPVRVATTANIALTGTQTIDTIGVVAGDRVLVKNQGTAAENGVYVVAAGAWSRSTDMDAATELNGATVLIEQGAVGIGDIYQQTATVVTINTDTVTWTKVSEGNTVYAADGTTLTLTGTTFSITNGGVTGTQLNSSVAGSGLAGGGGSALSVNVDSTTIEISTDTLRIAATAAGSGLTGGGGAALDVNVGAGLEISSDAVRIAASAAGSGLTGGAGSALDVNVGAGLEISSDAVRIAAAAAGGGLTGGAGSALAVGAGTGITVNADDVTVNHAVVPYLYATTLTGGATTETVTHNLGTRDVVVTVYGPTGTSYAEEDFSVEHATTTTVTIRSATNISAGGLRCVVLG